MEEDIKMTNEYLRKNLIASEEEIEKAIKLYNDKERMKDCLIELNYQLGISKSITADLEEKEKVEQKICAIVLLEVENEYIKERYKELEQNQCTHNIDNECIRKSKVKEKIEELSKEISYRKYFNVATRGNGKIFNSMNNFIDYLIKNEVLQVLQQLLEE